jgi:twinkle protein
MAKADGRTKLGEKQCPSCAEQGADRAGDNLIIYENGANCMACGFDAWKDARAKGKIWSLDQELKGANLESTQAKSRTQEPPKFLETHPIKGSVRGIKSDTLAKYNIEEGTYNGKDVIVFNQYKHGELVYQKVRSVDQKPLFMNKAGKPVRMTQIGTQQHLYGQEIFGEPSPKIPVVITEGEFDAAASSEMLDWPTVTMGASTAIKFVEDNLDWLMGWKHTVLCFDNDHAGAEAVKKVLELFDPGMCRVAKLPMKDANDMLEAGKPGVYTKCIFNASYERPKGLEDISEWAEEEEVEESEQVMSWPWARLNEMSYGLRTGKIYGIVAAPNIGKTEVLKTILNHTVKQKTPSIIFSFEEKRIETLKILASPAVGKDLLDPDNAIDKLTAAERKKYEAFKKKVSPLLTIYKSSLGSKWELIKRNIQVSVKCDRKKIVIIDGLTDLGDNCIVDGKKLSFSEGCDYVVSELAQLALTLDIVIIISAHLIKGQISKSMAMPSMAKSISSALEVSLDDRRRMLEAAGTEWSTGRVPDLSHMSGGKRLGEKSSLVLGLSRNTKALEEDEVFTTTLTILKTREVKGSINKSFKLHYNLHKLKLEENNDDII